MKKRVTAGAAVEALLRACGTSARSDYGRLTREVCDADRASPELAATIRECAILLMTCAADLNRAAAQTRACEDKRTDVDADSLMAALPQPTADGPAVHRLSYHALHALTAARETRDDPSIQTAEALACLAGLSIARGMIQQ